MMNSFKDMDERAGMRMRIAKDGRPLRMFGCALGVWCFAAGLLAAPPSKPATTQPGASGRKPAAAAKVPAAPAKAPANTPPSTQPTRNRPGKAGGPATNNKALEEARHRALQSIGKQPAVKEPAANAPGEAGEASPEASSAADEAQPVGVAPVPVTAPPGPSEPDSDQGADDPAVHAVASDGPPKAGSRPSQPAAARAHTPSEPGRGPQSGLSKMTPSTPGGPVSKDGRLGMPGTMQPGTRAGPEKPPIKAEGPGRAPVKPDNPVRPPRPGAMPPADRGAPPADVGETDSSPPLRDTTTTMQPWRFDITPPSPESKMYRFDYNRTPWAEVLADFSRMSGLSWLGEPDTTTLGELTFRCPRDLTYVEALHQLNELLITRGVDKYVIQRKENYLDFKRLTDLIYSPRDIPVSKMFASFVEMEATNPDEFDVVIVYLDVPAGWSGYDIIERFRPMVSDLYGTQVQGDKIELTGLVREHRRLRSVIEHMLLLVPDGKPLPVDQRPMLVIPLRSAKAADIQTILRQLYPGGPAAAPGRGPGPGVDGTADKFKQVDIIPDVKNNVLYIKAAPRTAAEIAELVQKLDSGEPQLPPQMTIVKLEFGDANTITTILKPIFQAEKAAAMKASGGPLSKEIETKLDRDIFPDPVNNAVILLGSPEGVGSAEQLVKQYDVEDTSKSTEQIDLKYAKAPALAGTLLAAMSRAAGPPGKGGPASPPPQILVRTSSSLLVTCNKKDMEDLKSLVARLDVPPEDEAKEHLVKLTKAKPSVVAQILSQLFSEGGPQMAMPRPGGPQGGAPVQAPSAGGARIRFIPVDPTGYLIVYCTDEDWKRADGLIKQLDEQERDPILKSIPIINADAQDVARMLQGMFPTPPAQPGQVAAREQIYADPYNNTVNIFASQDFIDRVEPIIKSLDIQTKEPPTVIHLEHARAENVAPVLQSLFGGRGVMTAATPVPPAQGGAPGQPPRPMMSLPAAAGSSPVTIVAEPITNSVIVSAPAKELEQIQKLVAEMEAKAIITQVILIPQNRSVGEIAETLQSLMASAQQPRGPRGMPPGTAAGGGLNLVPDGDRLILEGSQEDVTKALQYFEIIDVLEQELVTKKYLVSDPEKVQMKLQALLTMSAAPRQATPAAGAPGAPGAPGRPAVQPGATPIAPGRPTRFGAASSMTMFADADEGTLLIRAMPRDFIEIEAQLAFILKDGVDVPGMEDEEEGKDNFPFFTHRLKYKKALDIGWTLEDLVNTGTRYRIKFDEGPDEYTLLVRDCPPAKRELVLKYLEMWDVPTSSIGGMDLMVVDTEKIAADQLIGLIQTRWPNPNNRSIEVTDLTTGGRVQVVDIHEGEVPSPSGSLAPTPSSPAAPKPEPPPAATTQPVSMLRPGLMPLGMCEALASSALGQIVQANRPKGPVGPAACPVCGKSPCTLAAHAQPVGEAVARASFEGQPEPPVGGADPGRPSTQPVAPPAESSTPPSALESSEPARPASATSPLPASSQDPPTDATGSAVAPPASDGKIRLFPDPITGKLMIEAPEADKDLLRAWLEEITDGKSPTVYRLFPLRYADVNVAAQLLNNIFNQASGAAAARQQRQPRQAQGQQGQPGRPGEGGPQGQPGQPGQPQLPPQLMPPQAAAPETSVRLRVTPDPRTRSLWVAAPLSDIPLIVEVLRQVDSNVPPGEQNIRIFRLVNLNATEVAQNLREILGIAGGTPRRGQRGMIPGQPGQQMTPDQQQQMMILQMQGQQPGQGVVVGGDQNIKLTAVDQTNSIIAQAPPDTLNLIESLIETLEEQPESNPPVMRRIPLLHARASDLAPIVREVTSRVVSGPGGGGGMPGMPPGMMAGRMGGSASRSGNVSVNAEPRTNSLILAGQTADVERVVTIVQELDIDSGGSNIRQVAVKGDAQSMANTLRSIYGAGPQSDVIITADVSTNTLVIKAPAPTMVELEKQVADMDSKVAVTQEQRTIEVKFADAETIAQNIQSVFGDIRSRQGGKQNISAKGFKSSNVVIITGADDETFEKIKGLVSRLDVPPTGMQVKAFPLKHASAVAVNEQLTQMMAKAIGQQSGALSGVKMDLVGVVPDPRTNSLIVTGGPVTFSLIDSVLAEIDKEAIELARETRSYVLPLTVNALDVASNINALFAGQDARKTGMEPPSVTANAAANMVIAVANATQHEQIQKNVIEPLTLQMGEPMQDYQIPLKHARADEIRTTLQEFMNNWRQLRGNKPQDTCTITPDVNSNLLLVNCTPTTKAILDKQIAQLDQQSEVTLKTTKAIKLQNARADEILRPLTESMQAKTTPDPRGRWPFTLAVDVGSNSLIVTTTDKWMPDIEAQVAALDQQVDARKEYVIELKNANPNDVAGSVQAILDAQRASRRTQTGATIRAVPGTTMVVAFANVEEYEQIKGLVEQIDQAGESMQDFQLSLQHARADELRNTLQEFMNNWKMARGNKPQDTCTITPDVNSNMLLANCTPTAKEVLDKQLVLLDQPSKLTQRLTKTIKLHSARADEIQRPLNESLQAKTAPDARGRFPFTIAVDVGSNSLMIVATEELMPEIEAQVAALDLQVDARKEYVIDLKNSNPNDVANSVQAILDAQRASRRTQTGATIRAVPGTTKVVAFANAEEYEQIKGLVEQIDAGSGGRVVHTVVMPERVPAKTISESINKVFGPQSGRSGATDGPKADFHEPTNTLLVSATDAEYEKIDAQIIQPLSQQPAIGVMQMYKVPLKYASAVEVAETLQGFFDKRSGAAAQRSLPPWARDPSQQMNNQVSIVAEPTSNTLLIDCTETTKAVIDDLLVDIDTDKPRIERTMELVTLQFMDANEMLGILTEYLKVSKPETEGADVPWWMGGRGGRGGQQQESSILIGDTRLKAVESMNAVSVVGRPENVQDIIAKIKELDVESPQGNDPPQTLALEHARASELAETLNKMFNDPARNKARGASYVPPTITPVEATNSLLVRAKPADLNMIKSLVASMDTQIGESGTTGVTILPIPPGRDLEELASNIEDVINKNEDMKKELNRDYRPSKVKINPDTVSSTLLVAANKSQLEEVKRLAEDLLARGPAGGRTRNVIHLQNISPEKAQQLIEQLQQSGKAKSGSGGRGPRGDATWTKHHRWEQLERAGSDLSLSGSERASGYSSAKAEGSTGNSACPATLQGFYAQVACSMALAQVPTTQPAKPTEPVKAGRIRPQEPASKPAEPAAKPAQKPVEAAAKQPPQRPATSQPTPLTPAPTAAPAKPGVPSTTQPTGRAPIPGFSPEQQTPAQAPGPDFRNLSPAAREAFQKLLADAKVQPDAATRPTTMPSELSGKSLSGAPVDTAVAGATGLVIECSPEDFEVIQSILQMVDRAVPSKQIEYVKLKNSRAADLAKTLQDVFQRIEQTSRDKQTGPEDKVDVIADPRTNGIYIAATEVKMVQVLGLIAQADAEIPIEENVITYRFENRRVTEAGKVLKDWVASYLKQKGLPADAISVELDPQNNSVLITGGSSHLKFAQELLKGLDAELPDEEEKPGEESKSSMQSADIMVVPLRVANADKLGKLLNDLLQKAATGDTPMKDFIRRMRILNEKGEPIALIDLNKPMAIFGDPDSNALIIASSKENCLIMKEIAKVFDVEPSRAEVVEETLRLEFADATEVAQQLTDLLSESESLTKRPGGKGDAFGQPDGEAGALVYEAVIKADARTNQLMIVGRPSSVEVLKSFAIRLDVKGLEVMPFRIIPLECASATALEEALTALMEARAEALPQGKGENAGKAEMVIIKGDPRSRSLIVAARQAPWEEIQSLVKQLDIPSTALIEDIRTITLKNGAATDLAEKLKTLWEERQQQQESGSKGLGLEIPAIVADERSNSLIVAASKADFEAIKAVVDKIEALELNPMANIYIVRLRYNSASQLSGPLSTLFERRAEMRTVDGKVRPEDKVSIEADEVTNSLLVAASRENIEVLIQKVNELDLEMGVPGQVEFFECTNVDANRVKETVDELFNDGVYKSGGKGEGRIAEDREKVTTTVDSRSNTLIVSASPENMELIRQLYKRMNSVTTPWGIIQTALVNIEHGDAVKIAAQLQEHFDKLKSIEQSGSDSKGSSIYDITLFADERSNRLVVGGTKDGIDGAVAMIKKLDVLPGTPTQVLVVYTLREAPAAKIAEIIDRVFQERNQPRSGATGPQVPNVKVTVEAQDSNNSVVINASQEDHTLIADLITRLDRPSTLIDMVKVFPLERAPAERVKEILDELYQSTGGSQGSSSKSIAVVADKRTNAVVVAAPPGELENIGTLVKRLDATEVKGQAEIGVFTCENEDAKKMSELLNEIMTGKASSGGGGSTADQEIREISSMLITFSAEDRQGRDLLLKTVRENVQITYSERTNSVIVVAPTSTLELMEQLVRKLDRIEKRAVLVKVFHLINSDATKMVDILEKMLAETEGTEEQKAFQEGRELQVEGGVSSSGGVPSAASQGDAARKGTFGRPKTTFVADERTNSIIAAGWPEDVDVVADILDQLDSQDIPDRENIVITLNNKKATDVQTAMDTYFQAEQGRLDRLGESVSPQRRMDQEVTVVAHEESNQLLVSASPRYKNAVMEMVDQLDLPPPEVMIQVMIAEVTLDDRFQMGLEFALQELRFSETAVAGGNGVLQSSHFDVVGGTDLGAAGTGVAGFSFTMTGEDFNFLVRALQSDSRLEVIQRPMIMCQDNQEASIDLGQKVPFVRGTQVSTAGQVTSQVEYEDIGIKLNIEPIINPDGYVYLHVVQEISSIGDSSINIGNGVLAPVFNSRKADTYVAVKDQETLVIGGLITTSDSESETKVPFLGDIPGLGVLFRTTNRTKLKTELLIALTPRIVRTVEDGRRLSVESRDKSKIITPSMKQSPMFGRLQVLPDDEEGGYGGEDGVWTPGAEPGTGEWKVLPPRGPSKDVEPAEKYGPEAPRYGPLVPASDGVVTERTGRPISAGVFP